MPRSHTLFSSVLSFVVLLGLGLTSCTRSPPAVELDPGAKSRDEALAVVGRYVKAIGGKKRLSEKRSMRTVGTVSLMGQTGTVEVRVIPGGSFLQTMSLPALGLENVSGSDGEHGWTFDSMSGAQLMPEAMHEQLRRESDPSSVMRYDEIYPVIEYLGEREFEGTPVDTVRVVDRDGLESIQHYSKESGLLIGGEGDQDSPQGPMRVKSVMSEYKAFEGLKIATRNTMVMGPMTMEMTIETVEVGTVTPEDLTPPPAVQKLLEKVAAKEAEKKAEDGADGKGEGKDKKKEKDEDGEG